MAASGLCDEVRRHCAAIHQAIVAGWHEVDEVVGVEVADDDRVEVGRIEQPAQPGKRAVA